MRSIQGHIKKLELAGLLEVKRGDGRGNCSTYRLRIHKRVHEVHPLKGKRVHEVHPLKGKRVHMVHKKGAGDAPRTGKREQVIKRGVSLSENWSLPEDWKVWAEGERPDLNINTEAEMFRDYWISKPGKDARKRNWLATWRIWIRKAYQGKKTNPKDIYEKYER